jgi:hypothetical protein
MTDKARRKELLRQCVEEEQTKARGNFPLPDETLEGFFTQLEMAMHNHGCFHDIRHSQKIIDAMSLADEQANTLLDWCAENGGYCDCEICANTQEHWRENRKIV